MTEKWKFSDIELASPGMRRQIAVYARPDDDPVLEILMTRDGTKAGRHLVHRRQIEPLARAVSIAQGGAIADADGRHSAGEITMRGGARVSFLVVLGRTPAVQLWLAAPDGRRLGRPTTISGAELVALGHAIDHLRSIGVGGTGPRGVSLASRGTAFGALQRNPVAAPTRPEDYAANKAATAAGFARQTRRSNAGIKR